MLLGIHILQMIGSFKTILIFIRDFCVSYCAPMMFRSKKKKIYDVILIKPDNLGDVILFTSCLGSFDYSSSKILIMVRSEFVEVVRNLLPEVEVKPLPFQGRLKGYNQIITAAKNLADYDTKKLIIPVRSRNFYNTDIYVLLLNYKYSITTKHDGQNTKFFLGKIIENILYNKTVRAHTSERKTILKLLSYNFKSIAKKDANKVLVESNYSSLNNYIVLSPYTTDSKRDIPSIILQDIINKLQEKRIKIYLVGSNSDKSKVFMSESTYIKNLVGKTSILELLSIIKNSSGVVCAETGTLQIANYFNQKVIAFVGGGHYGRFFNPEGDSNTKIVISDDKSCFLCRWQCHKLEDSSTLSYPCMSSINYTNALNSFIKEI